MYINSVPGWITFQQSLMVLSQGAGGIGYLDLAGLTSWVREVLRDKELAEAIREAHNRAGSYAEGAVEARTLIAHRLRQCEEALETTG